MTDMPKPGVVLLCKSVYTKIDSWETMIRDDYVYYVSHDRRGEKIMFTVLGVSYIKGIHLERLICSTLEGTLIIFMKDDQYEVLC